MKLRTAFLFLVFILVSACGPIVISPVTPPPSSQPPNGLPDLAITGVYLAMQNVAGGGANCVTQYGPFEIRVIVQNLGQVPASNISVSEFSTNASLIIGELGSLQSIEVNFTALAPNGTYNFLVDELNSISESNEDNNNFSYIAPTPTPPMLCTPTVPSDSTPIPSLTPDAPEPLPQTTPLIIWQSLDSPCKTASFWADQMAYGFCPPSTAPLSVVYANLPDYISRYSIWMQAYAPFTAQTRAGTVTFNGSGFVIPTEAEQRMMAEWAARMYGEVPGNTITADALVLSQSMSTPEACFDVNIYRDGMYIVFGCQGGVAKPSVNGYLDANELLYLYRWLDAYVPFQEELQQSKLFFAGQGSAVMKIPDRISLETLILNVAERAQAYTSGGGYPSAAFAAQKFLSGLLVIGLDQIQIRNVEPVDFPDSCMDAPKPNEVCVPVITPGLRVTLEAQGMLYEFHTDTAGYDLRQYGQPQSLQSAGG